MSDQRNRISRRAALPWTILDQRVQQQHGEANAGLWLDTGLQEQSSGTITRGRLGEKRNAKDHLVREVAGLAVPPAYGAFARRWAAQLEALGAQLRLGTVRGRLAVGIGAEAVIDNSIALHRTYGVPIIPGSALKGLAAAYAHKCLERDEWRKQGERKDQAERSAEYGAWARHFFGSIAQRGNVVFYDALWLPRADERPLEPDVITVHHQDYYAKGTQPPADWDSPVPVPLLSAVGCYLFALQGASDELAATWQILSWALDELGVGAKTSSGYGRVTLAANSCNAAAVEQTIAATKPHKQGAQQQQPGPVSPQPQQSQPAPAQRPPEPPPAPVRKAGYAVGDVFGGTVSDIGTKGVIVETPRGGYGLIEEANRAGKQYRKDDTARVEVIGTKSTAKGELLLLKPAPPKPKK